MRYVNKSSLIWSHGENKMYDFVAHLNTIHNNVQFTLERDRKLPFLDALVYRNKDGSLGRSAYTKTTHTNLFE